MFLVLQLHELPVIFISTTTCVQQIKSLLQSVGTSFCRDYVDWFGNESSDKHSRNADRSALANFLQAHPVDFSTTKLQVFSLCLLFLLVISIILLNYHRLVYKFRL